MEEELGAQGLSENGHKEYCWRIMDGESRLVVVAIGFTITGLEHEAYEAFEARMVRFAGVLGRLQYRVVRLKFQRRKAQGRRHWVEFECETPEARLPRVEEGDT